MNITGTQKRSIAQQTGEVFFDFSFSASDSTGLHSFGISGAEKFGFTLSGGKLFDPAGKFVYSYLPNQSVRVSGLVSPDTYQYWANSNLLCWGQTTSPTLYASPISHLYAESSSSLELSSFLRGELADYSLEYTGQYQNTNPLVSGKIINNSAGRAFRIFDASINGQSSYSLHSFTTGDIAGTGYIVFSGDGLGLQDEIVPVSLQTNFGQVDYDFTISGDYGITPDVYLNLSPDSTVAISNRPLYLNVVTSNYPSGSHLGVSLEYISGTTGNIYYYSGQTGFATQTMSGNITGCGALSYEVTGLVSGLDPKTSLWETGVGTGQFSTNTYCATGNVSGDYSLNLYGLGAGTLTLNYLASGDSSGYYYGRVPIVGEWLNAVATGYSGSGSAPVAAGGLILTGTGKVFVYPTGCLSIVETVTSGDYTEANLSVSKVYSGPIVYQYSTIGVGFATGRTFSGIVGSSFVPEFEQGSYYFSKYYSGLISGNSVISTGLFEINSCPSSSMVSGIITGVFSADYPLLCSNIYNFPTIPVGGTPLFIYNADGSLADPNTVFTFVPSGGYSLYEESLASHSAGGTTRTKTSRMGATASGEGTFYHPVANCASVPRDTTANDVLDHVWKEQISGTTSYSAFDSLDNGIGTVNTKLFITGTGDFYQDPLGAADSGVMDFFISGSGAKSIALKGLNKGQTDRILNMTLYKNGILSDSWENIYIEGSLYDKYTEATSNTTPYDSVVISELESGRYSLVVTAKNVAEPQVSFSQGIFSGCESSRNILVTVQAHGYFRKACCVKMTNYYEVTAHSGVHYDPIYLDYTNQTLVDSGCESVGAHAPRGSGCPGICFEASSPNYMGRWKEETKTCSFTIPIYDNSVYGKTATFNLALESASGCSLIYPSESTVQILDNDNEEFLTVGGSMPDISSLDCSLVEDVEPPTPNPCVFDPSLCDPCITNPERCYPPEPPCQCGDVVVECIPCSNTQTVVGTCNGIPVSGEVGIPGQNCGTISSSGCGPTTGYIFVGKIPISGAYPIFNFAGTCLASEVLAYPSNCGIIVDSLCTGNTGECPQTIEWSGCSDNSFGGITCSGSDGNGGQIIPVGRDLCTNYGDGEYRGAVTACALDIFLKVYSTSSCSSSSHGCHSWGFTGSSVFPPGDPVEILCDAFY